MKYLLISIGVIAVFLVGVLALTGSHEKAVGIDGLPNVGVITEQVTADKATLLDVRTPVEFYIGHANVAENFNVARMMRGELPDYPKDRTLYLYCNSGHRTGIAAGILKNAGFTDIVDLGAFSNWKDVGGETAQTELADYQTILNNIGAQPLQALGPVDAKLTMVKYTDFECPYCAKYTTETEPQILEDYVEGPDAQVRYEVRNLVVHGGEAALAAIGGYCANEQSLFWPYQDELTKSFNQNGSEMYTYDGLSEILGSAGGNSDEFLSCLLSDKYDKVVASETIKELNDGINSTPSFIIGSQTLSGALPFDNFKQVIEAQL